MGMIPKLFPNLLQIAGLVLVAVGLWMIVPWLGVFAAGVCCVLVGVALETASTPKDDGDV